VKRRQANVVSIDAGRRDLTERERRVLTELALGCSTEEVAAAMHLSPHTVRSHIKSALRKLRAQTRSHAVAIALARGEIDVDLLLTG